MKNPLMLGALYMLVEIALFIFVGKAMGVFATLALIIATSALGLYLLKRNGTQAFNQMKQAMTQGQAPGVALIEGFLKLVGAIALILPGFLTKVIGGAMQLSIMRKAVKPAIFYVLRKKMKHSQVVIYQK